MGSKANFHYVTKMSNGPNANRIENHPVFSNDKSQAILAGQLSIAVNLNKKFTLHILYLSHKVRVMKGGHIAYIFNIMVCSISIVLGVVRPQRE